MSKLQAPMESELPWVLNQPQRAYPEGVVSNVPSYYRGRDIRQPLRKKSLFFSSVARDHLQDSPYASPRNFAHKIPKYSCVAMPASLSAEVPGKKLPRSKWLLER